MKLHTTSSADIIQECRVMFGVKSVSKSIFFLLGNGQTYATLGVPYFRVSRIFMSRIFTLAFWCRIFMSRNFMSRIFSVPACT